MTKNNTIIVFNIVVHILNLKNNTNVLGSMCCVAHGEGWI